jgi:hypothetical protein
MAGILDFIKIMLTVQLFWAFAVTGIVATLPADQVNLVSVYTTQSGTVNIGTITNQLNTGITNQFNIPLLDLGALIFYSGNIIINLVLNFFTAIPQMFTLFISGIFFFIPLDVTLQNSIKLFIAGLIFIYYMLGVLGFITNMRSRGGVIQ